MSPDTAWIKATASDTGGSCVQLRRHDGSPEVRDSKNPTGPVLRISPTGLSAWLDAARRGELDRLTH
jgi:hypothetical protein